MWFGTLKVGKLKEECKKKKRRKNVSPFPPMCPLTPPQNICEGTWNWQILIFPEKLWFKPILYKKIKCVGIRGLGGGDHGDTSGSFSLFLRVSLIFP